MSIALKDYDLICSNSPINAGGVAVYISKNFVTQSISKQDLQVENCEDLWLHTSVRNTLILFTPGVLFRHPHHSTNEFIESLKDKLADFNSAKTTYNILGDIKIDISSNAQSSNKRNYMIMLENNGAVSIITEPTRTGRKLGNALPPRNHL